MCFPIGSGEGPDKIVHQVFEDVLSKSNSNVGLNFLKSLTKLVNLLGEGEITKQLRLFFFRAKFIALIKINEGSQPIAIGNTLRRMASKSAGSKALAERQIVVVSFHVACETKGGATKKLLTPLET